ncbi:1,4-dihydroxy-2-naphthoate octaprenyltransferase [Halobiforma haloterrestris]|uniref:1,4-dihydroxy-2-naphthoate octaprenyltransferase n=1 Tax=Natronobacterium haloterrestre TaxID=148448 RepID=A0A1I1IAZ3_NATHA|nr:prenyltransferase [Halobiforma haloterrestris]SFC32962.1 1,4-dihydroxy-2-naphthoate octaprenyltransferase [Halobiforma haloterrestris]
MSVAELRSAAVDRAPRLWCLWAASRPSQVALVVLVYLLGVGLSTAGPPVAAAESATGPGEVTTEVLGPVLAGALALLPVTVAIHYANEYADVETDALTERTPFSGGSGALEATGLPPAFLRRATIVAVGLSAAAIVAGLVAGALPLEAVGLLVAILIPGLAYSLPPLALIRRGIGEFVNVALGGLLLPLYGVATASRPTGIAVLAIVPFALAVGCNLLATHWPDREADAAVGKRTLVVRWSPDRVRRVYAVLAGAAAAVTVGLWGVDLLPTEVALATLGPLALLGRGWWVLTRQRSPFPSVLAMVGVAAASTAAWWWVGVFS